MNTDVRPLWGDNNTGTKTLLDSRSTPSIGSVISVDGLKATVVNTFINEGKMFITYKIGNEVFTREYNSGVICG